MNRYNAIILAAGQGKRYGQPKQFELLKGKEIWRWSHETIKPFVSKIIVVGVDIPGGKSRKESLEAGLNLVDSKYVIVHDSARPLVKSSDIEKIIKELESGVQSATFFMPLSNTILTKDKENISYLDRNKLFSIATPQAFETKILKKAHEIDKNIYLDDCSVVHSALRINPKLIKGGLNLYKLTYKEELKFLETMC